MFGLDWETAAILVGLGAFPVSLALTRFFMWWNAARGIVGIDVHKLSRPKVPEMCGAAVPITLILFGAIYCFVAGSNWIGFAAYSLVVGSAALVGAADDRLKMPGIFKPLLTLFCGLPLLIMGLAFPGEIYNPILRVPLFGAYHLHVIYPLTILVVISVTSNTVNMLDPLNGSMAGGVSIVAGGILIGLILTGSGSSNPFPVSLYASLMFSLLGFLYYNRFPSRAFSGNVGQLSIGASLGALAILGRTEIASIVAMFPNIQNSFFFLSRIRRFTEHRQLKVRPTRLLDDGRLASSEDPAAPLTLVRTLVVGRPATEPDIVSSIWALFLASTSLAIVTLLLLGVTV